MSSLTRDDLKTILKFGVHIAKIDQDFAVWEKRVLARFAEAMKLTEDEKTAMVREEISLAQGLGALSGQDAKQLLVKTLCAVAQSDGIPHEAEVEFIHKVIGRLGAQVFVLSKDEWGTYEKEVLEAIAGAV